MEHNKRWEPAHKAAQSANIHIARQRDMSMERKRNANGTARAQVNRNIETIWRRYYETGTAFRL